MFSCEYCGSFKMSRFETRLRTAASTRCYFDTINLKESGFCTAFSSKILLSERKYKNNLKYGKSQKNLLQFSYTVCNVYVMLYCKNSWFYQYFKSENLCFLYLYSVHAVRILDLSLEVMSSPLKWGTKHLYNSKSFSFM